MPGFFLFGLGKAILEFLVRLAGGLLQKCQSLFCHQTFQRLKLARY